jgi:hypothetical protein
VVVVVEIGIGEEVVEVGEVEEVGAVQVVQLLNKG